LLVIFLVVFGGFACLFPLAFYCLVLANLNNRRRPTLVPGPSDFAGVLLATAGFVIVGGPLILAGLHESWRRGLLRGSFASIRAALAESTSPWLLLWATYFAIVVGGAVWLLLRRRAVSVVYNIDPAAGQKLVAELLDHLGLPWGRRDGAYLIDSQGQPSTARRSASRSERASRMPVGQTVLEVTEAPVLRHLTLRWTAGNGAARSRFEAELRNALEHVESPANPAAGWFLTAASTLFIVLLALLGLFILFLYLLRT
jgi:hypothetical protein